MLGKRSIVYTTILCIGISMALIGGVGVAIADETNTNTTEDTNEPNALNNFLEEELKSTGSEITESSTDDVDVQVYPADGHSISDTKSAAQSVGNVKTSGENSLILQAPSEGVLELADDEAIGKIQHVNKAIPNEQGVEKIGAE